MGLIEENNEMNSVVRAWVKLWERIAVMKDPQRRYVLENIDAARNVLKGDGNGDA